jgi:hypothetical protein
MPLRSIAIMAAVLAGLAGVYFAANRAQLPIEPERLPFVWRLAPEALTRVRVALPREGKAEAWARRDEINWTFEKSGETVEEARWGLGIPLLLSGPRAARTIGEVESSRLDAYGLANPRVTIELDLVDGSRVVALVGDATPDGAEDYVGIEGSRTVYSVSREWAAVMERLVREPPVAKP